MNIAQARLWDLDGPAFREPEPLLVPRAAQPHPARYLLHKYWGRKPHNIVAAYVDAYSAPGQVVLDPFCGSGVTPIEAALLGRRSIGIDLNPVATLMAAVTLQPLSRSERANVTSWVYQVSERIRHQFYAVPCPQCSGSAELRTLAWVRVATCRSCAATNPVVSRRKDRNPTCASCGAGLASLATSEVIDESWIDCGTCGVVHGHGELKGLPDPQLGASPFAEVRIYENRRILASPGMGLETFFSPRGSLMIRMVLDALSELPDRERRFAEVLLTSASAQASRMLPYRQGMATGGPAWSVPGFWFPAHRVEPNFGRSLLGKLRKGLRALDDVARHLPAPLRVREAPSPDAEVMILTGTATDMPLEDESVDYVFTDPPYGGSVPYLEFSAMWNGLLGADPAYESEIVVSDSTQREKDHSRYEVELTAAFRETLRVLRSGCFMHLTFQHLSDDMWRLLRRCVQGAGFDYLGEVLQTPAVRSAKSQLAPDGSPIGDVILAFRKP
jgi:16S rRNA G966 N2-methylase RsmD